MNLEKETNFQAKQIYLLEVEQIPGTLPLVDEKRPFHFAMCKAHHLCTLMHLVTRWDIVPLHL